MVQEALPEGEARVRERAPHGGRGGRGLAGREREEGGLRGGEGRRGSGGGDAPAGRRVDELFLDCEEAGGNSGRRPYWQCLTLSGRLRDQIVAVHQWWSGMLK